MAVRIGGLKRKSKFKIKKERRRKGKISISRFMQSFKKDQKVHLILESSFHKGEPYTPFIGKTGTIKSQRGKCYEVSIKDGNKEKLLIIHPIHLKASS